MRVFAQLGVSLRELKHFFGKKVNHNAGTQRTVIRCTDTAPKDLMAIDESVVEVGEPEAEDENRREQEQEPRHRSNLVSLETRTALVFGSDGYP